MSSIAQVKTLTISKQLSPECLTIRVDNAQVHFPIDDEGSEDGPPWYHAKSGTPPNEPDLDALRRLRFKRRDLLCKLFPGERCADCGRYVVRGGEGVAIVVSGDQAHYAGLETCGSVWVCPVCAAKINAVRRDELKRAMCDHERTGGGVYLLTLTLQHGLEDALVDLLDSLKDAWRRVKRGAPWKRICSQYDIVGQVGATEVTYGEHGWHPHIHALLFTERRLSETEEKSLRHDLTQRYLVMVQKVGRWGSEHYAVDLRSGEAAAKYVTKWGLDGEMTGGMSKEGQAHGLTPFQILDQYGNGDRASGVLFVEYAEAFKGRRQLVWSPGLRERLALGGDRADDELVVDDLVVDDLGQVEVVLTWEQWRAVIAHGLRCRLLEAVEGGGAAAVWALIAAVCGDEYAKTELNDRMLARWRDKDVIAAGVEYHHWLKEKRELDIKRETMKWFSDITPGSPAPGR